MSATVTAALNSANLKTASRNVAAQLGVDAANLSYEQRLGYNKALAALILTHPQSFNDTTLQVAQNISSASYTSLEDATFSWRDVGLVMADEAASVLNLGVFGKVAIAAAIAAAVWFFVIPAAVKSKAAAVFKAKGAA